MSCFNNKIRYELNNPILYTHFVSYTTCGDVNLLAKYDLVEIVFPSNTTSTLQISILDCRTNTLVYDINGRPVLGTQINPNQPYSIVFSPSFGGYILEGFTAPASSEEETEIKSREVIKK